MAAYNTSQLEQLWIQAGGDKTKAPLMAAIAMAESGGNPSAHNPSGATGLWQILGNPFPGNAYDPGTNAQMAVAKYKSQGLGAWTTYTSGAYKKYLPSSGGSSLDAATSALSSPFGPEFQIAGDVASTVAGAVNLPNPLAGLSDTGKALADLVKFITSPQWWLRVLECIGGVILIGFGLITLTGQRDTIVSTAAAAAKVAK